MPKPLSFAELSEASKERARGWLRSIDDGDWHESVFEDAVRMGGLMGIEIGARHRRTTANNTVQYPAIYYSGFASQGDGASFYGLYTHEPKAVENITAECGGTDAELIRIATELTALQVRVKMEHGGLLQAKIVTQGGNTNYMHSGCMQLESVEVAPWPEEDIPLYLEGEETTLRTLMRDFANWIYKRLNEEHDYQMSDEVIDEQLGQYVFKEDGRVL